MTLPIWRNIVSELRVPQPNTHDQWCVALEAVTPGKLLKIEVVVDPNRAPPEPGLWQPHGFDHMCSADGDFENTARGAGKPLSGAPLLAGAPIGALIGRIGGSTADQTIDTAASPARIVFSVGRQCVLLVPTAPTGSLYLGVNDDPSRMARVVGYLLVSIYEAV